MPHLTTSAADTTSLHILQTKKLHKNFSLLKYSPLGLCNINAKHTTSETDTSLNKQQIIKKKFSFLKNSPLLDYAVSALNKQPVTQIRH
jgi:hypothetical protein